MNNRGVGISNPGSTSTASNRTIIRNNYITDIGHRGILIHYMVKGQIIDNVVEQTNHNGIEIFKGTTQNSHYSRDCIIKGNIVNRSAAATTAQVSYAGFLIAIGPRSENIIVDSNVCNDNTTGGSGTDGIGWGHETGETWHNVVISNNIVANTGTFGIDGMQDCTITGNVIYKAGTHGIVITAGNAGPAAQSSCVVSNNVIVDANESNAGSGIGGISFNMYSTGTTTIEDIVITGNVVRDTRGTRQTHHGIAFTNVAGANTINRMVLKDNVIEDVLTSSILWPPASATADPELTITQLRFRDNITKSSDPYSGLETLSSGTVTATNSNWIDFVTLCGFTPMFLISRQDDNGSTSTGNLESKWNATDDDLDITAYRGAGDSIQLLDNTNGVAYPVVDADTTDLAINAVASAQAHPMDAPESWPVQAMYFYIEAITNGTSIDIFLEDEDSTRLTTSTTVTTATDDNTWVKLTGNGVSTTKGKVMRVVAENDTGNVTVLTVDHAIVIFSDSAGTQTNDVSKVYWEFIGTPT